MAISSIDEILMGGGGNSQQPDAPEYKEPENEDLEADAPEYEDELEEKEPDNIEEDNGNDEENEDKPVKEEVEEDEYGNTKERMSKGMKDRLDRKEKQHQKEIEQREYEINQLRSQLSSAGASHQVQQAAKDFEYDADAQGDWQQQLASFVKQTVQSMTKETEEAQNRQQEAQVQAEFETKFKNGMHKFDDFQHVISSLPFEISNPMTLATRAMDNPAAFLYAAAKRNPQDLERISKIRDPYAQMAEMGKLEERMRKNKPMTKAPRPLGRTPEDSSSKPKPKDKDNSGDDLLAKADAKRLSTVKTRLKGNR